jgi:hypothetical protein
MTTADAPHLETHTCTTCGETWHRKPTKGQRPKYCPACRGDSGQGRILMQCAACGRDVLKSQSKSGSRVVCSYACRAAITPKRPKAPKLPTFALAYYHDCAAGCGEQVYGAADHERQFPQYCSPACKRRKRPRVTGQARFVAGTCVVCGDCFVAEYGGHTKTCSAKCTARDAKARRRALRRGAYIEPVSWRLVAKRDGAACYLCHEDTDPSDYTYRTGSDGRPAFTAGHRFPTVDHVVALSNGGAHSQANAKLAHLVCNSRKGDR